MSPRLSIRAVFYKDDKILLCKHHDDRGFWYITPGGGVEHGETLEDAFHREIKEEVGLQAEMGKVLCIRDLISDRQPTSYLPNHFHQVEIFVEGINPIFTHEPHKMDPAQIGYEWIKLDDLPSLLFFPSSLVDIFQHKNFSNIYLGHKL
ncbi:NUDIX domain-containing protein [Photobacterium profundum]|uniref:MutT-like protein n=1 Tax=Photobacterium profundum 3TCK TaxID=314280 RepID=Q1YZE3_9GAMM|nr:NUDIX domain-containing protein [Photobacterium profundum]EAS41633.1 MutT-like protein [Photobacterium profundum 3TCK]PSV59721.1 NUDIX domain-containing protein [Photobacterium profundum]